MATTLQRVLYRGFSTAADSAKSFKTADFETVKRDLLNHIWTIPGERVMQPDFGTRIPLLAFEPLDEVTLKIVEDDLKKVFSYDPRVELIDLAVVALPDNNAIGAFADLRYIELNTTETLKLEFPTGS
jgi:phage baseplate assembly protein W